MIYASELVVDDFGKERTWCHVRRLSHNDFKLRRISKLQNSKDSLAFVEAFVSRNVSPSTAANLSCVRVERSSDSPLPSASFG